MSNYMQIGKGSKVWDTINLVMGGNLVFLLLIITVFDVQAFFLFLIVASVNAVSVFSMVRKHYIYYHNGNFLIEHIFKKRQVISSSLYKRINQDPFTIPFSNICVIHFEAKE